MGMVGDLVEGRTQATIIEHNERELADIEM